MNKVQIKIKIVMKKIKMLNKKEKNQFTDSSGLLPLISNPGADTVDRDIFNVSVPFQSWYVGPCGNG
jgi:hypothetical protein